MYTRVGEYSLVSFSFLRSLCSVHTSLFIYVCGYLYKDLFTRELGNIRLSRLAFLGLFSVCICLFWHKWSQSTLHLRELVRELVNTVGSPYVKRHVCILKRDLKKQAPPMSKETYWTEFAHSFQYVQTRFSMHTSLLTHISILCGEKRRWRKLKEFANWICNLWWICDVSFHTYFDNLWWKETLAYFERVRELYR